MVDISEFALGYQLVCQGNRWAPSVVEPHEGLGLLGFLGCLYHGAGIIEGTGQGFLAGDVLAGFEHGDRLVAMDIVGGADIDQVDLRVFGDVLPARCEVLPAPFGREVFELSCVAGADQTAMRDPGEIEEVGYLGVGIAMGAAHEFLADQGDVADLWHDQTGTERRG